MQMYKIFIKNHKIKGNISQNLVRKNVKDLFFYKLNHTFAFSKQIKMKRIAL